MLWEAIMNVIWWECLIGCYVTWHDSPHLQLHCVINALCFTLCTSDAHLSLSELFPWTESGNRSSLDFHLAKSPVRRAISVFAFVLASELGLSWCSKIRCTLPAGFGWVSVEWIWIVSLDIISVSLAVIPVVSLRIIKIFLGIISLV